MPGSATLDSSLVDSLNNDISALKDDLYTQFGVRAYAMHTVLRTWSGAIVGEGTSSDDENEIRPMPQVGKWNARRYELEPCGLDDVGEFEIQVEDLSYTHAELAGGELADNQQWLIKFTDAHGQLTPPFYCIHARPPFIDREKGMGWVCWMKRVAE